MLVYIFIAVLSVSLQPSLGRQRFQSLSNSIIDYLGRQADAANASKVFPLSDVRNNFPLFTGSATLQRGSVKFSGLFRISNVQVTPGVETVDVSMDINIGKIDAVFKQYIIKTLILRFNDGYLIARTKDNVIRVQLSFGNSICDVNIVDTSITRFGKFDVKLKSNAKTTAEITNLVLNEIFQLFNDLIKIEVSKW